MNTARALEMLNNGQIEQLKAELQDEIYAESLKGKPNAKKRYSAMKRYLKTISETRLILTKPCEVEFEGKKYNSFTNMYSLALTTEPCGELAMCDDPDRYPDVARLIPAGGEEGKIDFAKVLAEAKSQGYKYTKNSINYNEYLMRYKDGYFRVPLVDITYGIIDDGQAATVYYFGKQRPMVIKNDIGIALVLPIRGDGEFLQEATIINAE